MGKSFSEETLLRIAFAYEQATDWHKRKPSIGNPNSHKWGKTFLKIEQRDLTKKRGYVSLFMAEDKDLLTII